MVEFGVELLSGLMGFGALGDAHKALKDCSVAHDGRQRGCNVDLGLGAGTPKKNPGTPQAFRDFHACLLTINSRERCGNFVLRRCF